MDRAGCRLPFAQAQPDPASELVNQISRYCKRLSYLVLPVHKLKEKTNNQYVVTGCYMSRGSGSCLLDEVGSSAVVYLLALDPASL
jgi:hypothetical protein